jgi:hypothetical protein
MRGGEGGGGLELRFIRHGEPVVAAVSYAEEVGAVTVKGTDCMGARFKAEPAEIVGLAMDIERPALDLFLPQHEVEQLRPHSLPLKLRCNRHGTQVQSADLPVIGIGKGDISDDPAGMKTDPFMERSFLFVKLFHNFSFESCAKGEAEQGRDPGAVIDGQFLYFHGGQSLIVS